MQWLTVEETAERLDWDAAALRRLLTHTRGAVLPGAVREGDGTWQVPESALRRITGAGLFLFSLTTLAELLDCDYEHLRKLTKAGKLKAIKIPNIGVRVPWSEYQRLVNQGKEAA
jgi:hypothetical protein